MCGGAKTLCVGDRDEERVGGGGIAVLLGGWGELVMNVRGVVRAWFSRLVKNQFKSPSLLYPKYPHFLHH